MSNISLTPAFVANALSLPVSGATSSEVAGLGAFSSVVTDSRKIVPKCLFVALKGENFDGHDFIPAAVAQGAAGVICNKGTAPSPHTRFFEVTDTQAAFRALAGAWRNQFSIPVIAVAGSVGKTTTKELLAAILGGRFGSVLKTEGSQNGFLGIPMTLLELRPGHEAAVIEIGIDEIGAMKKHLDLVRPTSAVVTAIAPEHLEKLIDIETVTREELLALRFVSKTGGHVGVNLDDPRIAPLFASFSGQKAVGFSLRNAPGAALRGTLAGTEIGISGRDPLNGSYSLSLRGNHNASNFLAALSVAAGLELTRDEVSRGLARFRGAYGRSEIQKLADGTSVVCDYYNASPPSMVAGLELLALISTENGDGKRWACLADMLELGREEEQFHRELFEPIFRLGIERVLLLGPRMQALDQELRSRGISSRHFQNHSELASVLIRERKAGETVLIKGSRGMKMEEVWKLLKS